jgi:hypothetical protein
MSSIVAKLIRLFTAVILPVPLFVVIYSLPYSYEKYHGYDSELGAYNTDVTSLKFSRDHVWFDLAFMVFVGSWVCIGPSVLFSISLEVYRSRKFSSFNGYIALGGAVGGLTGIFDMWLFPTGVGPNVLDAITAVVLWFIIGAGIAAFLSMIGAPKLRAKTDK